MDMSDIIGQEVGKRAVEVAIIGGHSLLLIGPPGCGKSLLLEAGNSVAHDAGYSDDPVWHTLRPCPCGYHKSTKKECLCTAEELRCHFSSVREAMHAHQIVVQLPDVRVDDLVSRRPGESTAHILARIQRVGLRENRYFCLSTMLPRFALSDDCKSLYRQALQHLCLSVKKADDILCVARTIADMDGQEHIGVAHLAEAIQYAEIRQ